ncbi:Callose synthase 12 [Ranunculus cassubicifolius]
MSLRHRSTSIRDGLGTIQTFDDTQEHSEQAYNIIPIHNLLSDHPSLRYPEVRAVTSALRDIGSLGKIGIDDDPNNDIFDCLGLAFGFQLDNVRNQREHLLLHLANVQMRLPAPPINIDSLDPKVVRRFRRKFLHNYTSWCAYLGCKSNVQILDRRSSSVSVTRKELIYIALYLLIWGEAANLRFVPECICYIFHHMALELNQIDVAEGEVPDPCLYPSTYGRGDRFLKEIVTPLYQTIKSEVDRSRNGTVPHANWRNYDDINEYFWSNNCFQRLSWPIDIGRGFYSSEGKRKGVGKTGFVERRSFWNLFRSFDRLWILHILFFQAAVILAWEHDSDWSYPWEMLKKQDIQFRVLSVFITWAGLRLVLSIVDMLTQSGVVSLETGWLGVRMVLKIIFAGVWTAAFIILYILVWKWSSKAALMRKIYLAVATGFLLPELLAVALFVVPWVRNAIEETNLKIIYVFTWWFQTRVFVGRGMREGIWDSLRYSLFWILILATKFSFSYYLQIKPMVEPTKAVWKLKKIEYDWPEFFGMTHRLAVGLLWFPVILIYLMDIQIWYSIFSSLVGSLVGLFDHLGEIRDIQQLRLRFQFFASALQFNLMPVEQLCQTRGTIMNNINDFVRRMKLRYGLGRPFNKLESDQVGANKFTLLWNEIISIFREEDIISDNEVELLELPANTWNIRVVRWPCFLLCNELLLALSQVKELADATDKRLWRKISKHEYRRCAILESYDSFKHLFSVILKDNTEEKAIVANLFSEIENAIQTGKFTQTYRTTAIQPIHAKLVSLVDLLNKPKKDLNKLVNALQALYEIMVRDFPKAKRTIEQLKEDGLALLRPTTNSGLLFENSIELPDFENVSFYRQLRRLRTILTSRDAMINVPVNLEARRRIAFFSNSVFMNMPHAPQVEKMRCFSVLTPYYNEEVLYNKEMLRTENEDGISTLYYLQKIYADEWMNFLERMRREGMVNDEEVWTTKLRDLRFWASYRGQTLARTVRGMMYYNRALRMLAYLDSASEVEIRERSQGLATDGSMRQVSEMDRMGTPSDMSPDSHSMSRATSEMNMAFKGHEYGTTLMKYTYVVACQIYGSQKAKKDPHAEEILYLMRNNEALRVAYVDEVNVGRDEVVYYSVLVKYDQQLQKEVEIYRIRLPGPIKIGEGKPENQNHAFIFTRGDAVQTIDMNQDNYFEEALKMRNLLEEFRAYYGIRKPTILGVREHIFTGSVSSLAWFMSAQEMSFVTLGQRVLANPLKIRLHYGHPDVFDRFWFMTRGGLSKASRVINISEDIFAGFNCTLRGGNVTHHEYIQVGKGRDVGLNQISMFEAKVASGNGEQVLSRDVYRLGHRLDFFRMLSFFYTTVGFFFNTMMVVLTVYAFVWGRLILALSGIEKAMKNSTNNKAFGAILNQQFIIQLGLFTALPMIVENSLEHGFLTAVWDFFKMQLQLSSVFYSFSMGTRTHYFGRTILHGGAKYRATGRGFVVQHKSFAENYRLYARSHFVKAIELGTILTIYAANSPIAKNTFVYIAMTVSSWFLVLAWILAPFVFNPSGFDWLKTVYDFDDFMNWIWCRGWVFTKAEQSWETWWYEEQDHLKTTGFWGRLSEIILDLRFFFFQYGIVYHLGIANGSTSIAVYLLSWVYVLAVVCVYIIISTAREKYEAKRHSKYRLVQLLVVGFIILVVAVLLKFTAFRFVDLLSGVLAFIPTGWGLISIAQVFRSSLQSTLMWDTVVSLARFYDILFGVIVMSPVAFLSWMPGFQSMQTRILFNDAFSRGLHISRLLVGKKPNMI